MSRTVLTAAIALCFLITSIGLAEDHPLTPVNEHDHVSIRQPSRWLSEEPVGYAEATDSESLHQPFDATAFDITAYSGRPTFNQMHDAAAVDDQPWSESGAGCCDVVGCSSTIDCGKANRQSSWQREFGVSALQSNMATADVDAWPDDFGPAGRISLGYEWPDGFGVRTQAWGYFMEGDVYDQPSVNSYPWFFYSDDSYCDSYYSYPYYWIPGALNQPLYSSGFTRPIEVTAATVYLDFYKTIHSGNGELTIGAGPAFGHLEFIFPPAGDGSKFYGGGISALCQGYYPIVRRNRWEFAVTGKSRIALLAGHWDIEFSTTDTEHSDNMSILELGFGPELRRRFGRAAEHYWFVRTLAEFQQWRSDRMGPIAGDTLALQGASIDFGLVW